MIKMIIQKHFIVGEHELVRTYSDRGVKIHGGVPEGDYDVAEDPASFNRTYTETDIPIDGGEVTAEEALDFLFGGES